MLEIVVMSNEEVLGTMTIVRTVPSIPMPRGRGVGGYQVRLNTPGRVAGPVEIHGFQRSRGAWSLVREALGALQSHGLLPGPSHAQKGSESRSKPPVVQAVAEPGEDQPEPA